MVIKLSELKEVIKNEECYSSVDILEMKAPPVHPGEILREEFLKPLGLSQSKLAEELGVDKRLIDEIINEKVGISPEMAIRISKRFGTTAKFWLNLQTNYDLWYTAKKMKMAGAL